MEYEIIKKYGVISERTKGWRCELNSVSWNGAEPKYDIRTWSPDHEKMGKGITLTENELFELRKLINNIYDDDDDKFLENISKL